MSRDLGLLKVIACKFTSGLRPEGTRPTKFPNTSAPLSPVITARSWTAGYPYIPHVPQRNESTIGEGGLQSKNRIDLDTLEAGNRDPTLARNRRSHRYLCERNLDHGTRPITVGTHSQLPSGIGLASTISTRRLSGASAKKLRCPTSVLRVIGSTMSTPAARMRS